MVRINIDLRFAFIATEGHIARRHAEIALRRLSTTSGEIRKIVLSELEASGDAQDEVERDTAFHEIFLLEDELPRLEIYGVVFVLFAVYESVVKRLPGEISPKTTAPSLSRDFLSNAARCYRKTLGVSLLENGSEEEFLRMLSDLRTAIAHATGNVTLLSETLKRRILDQWTGKYGLQVKEDNIVISPQLVLRAATVVDQSLSNLITRLKQAYPPRRRK